MSERDRRVIEAMMAEADDYHIVDPETGAEIDQDGGIPVTPEQFKSLLAGESAVVGLTRRVLTLADGPFSIRRGGPGSGFKGHEGRPGEVGGSKASPLGPQEEHKPVKSKRKGQAMTGQARPAAYRMADLLETIQEESQAGNSGETASWKYLSSLANRNARSMEAGGGEESVPLVESQRTNLWLVYHGIQHMLNTTDLRDGLDEEENATLQAVGDLLGDFEPEATERQRYGAAEESGLAQAPAELLRSYLGDDSTPGYLPEEVTSDPYLRYQTARIISEFGVSMEGSYLEVYNGTDESYLDITRMMAARDEVGGGISSDPEAWNAVVETWRQRAVSDENTSESALAMREAPMDPNFWAHNQAMELSFGQWLPTDLTPDLYETANVLNAGWMADPQHSAGGVALEEAAARIFGGTAPSRETPEQVAPSAGSAVEVSLLDAPQTQEQTNRIVQGMYDGTQAWLADRGYHPGDTVRLYRGLGNIEGAWNPLRGPGEGNLQMFAVSSWSFDHSEAEAFTSAGVTVGQTAESAVVAADIPIERLLANSDTGVPCEREGEWLVLGMDGIRGKVYRESDPPLAWQYDIDPALSPQQVRAQVGQMTTRSAVCLGFLPVSVPAQVITPQGWREIAARQATAPDPSLPIINVEADGDWIGNKLAVYGLTRGDVDGLAQPGTGKESAQKPQQSGKPGDEEKAKAKEGGAPNKEAGLRAYARAKRAARVRRERERSAGRQRLQSGVPLVVERGGEGSGHFGHEGRPGEVGGSAPSGHKTPETWQDMVAGFQWDAFTPEQIAAYRPGRESYAFFRKQAVEEMAQLDPRKITRQEFVGPDHYNLLTSAQIAMMGVDRGNTLRSVLVGREYVREMVWETAVRHQIALGLLEPRDAWDLGDASMATSASRNVMGEGGWAPLPERLYHVTTAASAVARDGLLSRDDLNMELSPGLGGGESDTISFTTNFALAQDIDRAFHEARMVASGEFTVAQMAEQARSGFAANAPFAEGITSGLEGDDAEAYLDRNIQAEASATSPEGFAQNRWNIYQQFLEVRQRAGGPANPVFFGTDHKALAQLDPADFTILEYRPRPGAMGYQVGGMSEWRTVGGDTVELLGQHESITPETEGSILGRTWRAIMRSRGVIARPHPLPKAKEPETPKYTPRPDRQTYGTSIFNPQLREVVYAWPGSKGAMARAVFEKVAKAQAAGNQDITGMVLGSYAEPMGLAALRYVRADGGDVESLQVLGMVGVAPGFGEEMWVQLAGEAAGRGVGLWVRPAKNARKFYDEIGMTFEETPDGPKCSWSAEQVATVARQAQANTDYLLPPGATRLLPAFEDKYTETQPVTPASPDLDAPEPEGDKDWQDRYLWTDFVMGKWVNREKPDANRILGGQEDKQGQVKPVDGADRVEELSAAWNGGTGLGAIRLSEAVVEAYGGDPIPASVLPRDYLDKFGDKAFERVPESEVLGMAPDERTKRLADQAAKDDRMQPGDFPFNLADLAEQVYDGTQLALEEGGIPLESMVRLYRGIQGDPSTIVPEGYDGGWVQTKLYALSPWTFSKAVAAAYATAPQEVGGEPLPGSLIAADFPRDRVWSTWATGPGSREHFEFIVLGLDGIRGWLTRVERKGTPGPPEPPREATP